MTETPANKLKEAFSEAKRCLQNGSKHANALALWRVDPDCRNALKIIIDLDDAVKSSPPAPMAGIYRDQLLGQLVFVTGGEVGRHFTSHAVMDEVRATYAQMKANKPADLVDSVEIDPRRGFSVPSARRY